jgi:hypothetical protein
MELVQSPEVRELIDKLIDDEIVKLIDAEIVKADDQPSNIAVIPVVNPGVAILGGSVFRLRHRRPPLVR